VNRAERLIDVAAAVADGSPVDWDRAQRSVDAGARTIARNLALVERIASIHAALPVGAFERSLHDSLAALDGDPPSDEVRSTWGPLTIIERIGNGRYADVYLARDPRLDRPVALKLLRHRDNRDTAGETEAIHEARLLARVTHPNVITVYGAERIDGRAGIWMEFVDGRTLEQELVDRGPLPADEIGAIGAALCGAVGAVHAAGLLHRDIKTQNVMRRKDGRIVLSDFGTSHEIAECGAGSHIVGTPLYLAPEVLRGEPPTAAGDVYSVGVLLYHLATGAFPICGRSLADLRDAFAANARVPVRQRRPDLPQPLAAVIERATDPLPERRFKSAEAMGTAIAAAATRTRRVFWAAVASVALLVGVTGAAARWRAAGTPRAPRLVLVGAFDNQTGDQRLDDLVQVAFSQELMQSRAVTVAPPERINDTLRLMKRPASTRLDARTAREICLRDGEIQLFASGRIDRLGAAYALRATIAQASTGASVAHATIDVADIDGVLSGVRTLVARMRAALGDARHEVDADARLEPVTTGSLDALREYTAGVRLFNEWQWPAAELRLGEAVRLDPSFASALIMLAEARRNRLGRPATQYVATAEQALQLAHALPARERYFVEGSYYTMTGDWASAIAALEALTRAYPEDYWGLYSLAVAYEGSGRFRDENAIAKRLAALRPNDFISLLDNAAALIVNGDGLTDAHRIVERASRLERPRGNPGDVYSAWLDLFPAFEAWAQGRVTDSASLVDALEATALSDDVRAFRQGQMNLTLGRVHAAERAFQSLSSPAERTAMLAYAALARGDTSGARAALVRAAPDLTGALALGVGSFGRAAAICWSLMRTGLVDECRRLGSQRPLNQDGSRWIVGELAAADWDYETALPILQHMRTLQLGIPQMFVALDTLAGIFEQRGDLDSAADALRLSEGAERTLYPQSGPGGFSWLQARAHLLAIERRLGHVERADTIARQLQRLLAVADRDFVIRQALP
jgi:tetratricopeptide (TPR) repeat protein